MTRTTAIVSALVLLGAASAVRAQFDNPRLSDPTGQNSISERYNKAKKGSNMNEWSTRLRSDEPSIRLEAVKSIGDSGDPEGIELLMGAVGDPDMRVRAKAVDYLGDLRATDATFLLVQRLFMAGTPDGLRHRILMALGKIGDPKASRPIVEFLARDVDPDIRGTGIYALGEIGDPSIEGDLKRMLETEENPNLVRLIQEALRKIALRKAQPPERSGPFPSPLEAALRPDTPPEQ